MQNYYKIDDVIIPDGYRKLNVGEIITDYSLVVCYDLKFRKSGFSGEILTGYLTDFLYIIPIDQTNSLENTLAQLKSKTKESTMNTNTESKLNFPDGYQELNPDDIITEEHFLINIGQFIKNWTTPRSTNIKNWTTPRSTLGQKYKDFNKDYIVIKPIQPPKMKPRKHIIDGCEIDLIPEQIQKINDHNEKLKKEEEQYLYKKDDLLICIYTIENNHYVQIYKARRDGDGRQLINRNQRIKKATPEQIDFYNKLTDPSTKIEIK